MRIASGEHRGAAVVPVQAANDWIMVDVLNMSGDVVQSGMIVRADRVLFEDDDDRAWIEAATATNAWDVRPAVALQRRWVAAGVAGRVSEAAGTAQGTPRALAIACMT